MSWYNFADAQTLNPYFENLHEKKLKQGNSKTLSFPLHYLLIFILFLMCYHTLDFIEKLQWIIKSMLILKSCMLNAGASINTSPTPLHAIKFLNHAITHRQEGIQAFTLLLGKWQPTRKFGSWMTANIGKEILSLKFIGLK